MCNDQNFWATKKLSHKDVLCGRAPKTEQIYGKQSYFAGEVILTVKNICIHKA